MKIKRYNEYINEQIVNSPLLDLKDNVDYELMNIIEDNFEKGSKILEISCGNAEDSLYLKSKGYDVICTEIDDNYVDNAINKGLNCIKHDTRKEFPFDSKEFDLIYSRLGLHYFNEEQLDYIFGELNRIGNSLLITVKIEQDVTFKHNKVILTPDKWKNIISKYFNIKQFNIKEGKLYGNESMWLEIFAK